MTNLEYWQAYGDYVFMAMPYADEVVVEARGCKIRDADGNELLDLASGMFCSILGHNHPEFIRRLGAQIDRVLHTGTQFLSPPVLEASYKLSQVTPGNLKKSIFFSTGTEANEFAFRIAKAYTGRTAIMGLSRGYYGTSLATKSCSSLFSYALKDALPVVPENLRLPITPECAACFSGANDHACEFKCLTTAGSWIGDWSNVAAVIVEPFLSAGGMLLPCPGYLKRLRAMAHEHGALFIVDEAQTGFGRTGRWFAIEHHDAVPDILTLSKSVGNGFPVGAVVTTPEIADKVVAAGLWNLSSHQSDPAGASAVAAVIDIVKEENLIERAREQGEYFIQRLRDLAARKPAIRNIRGQGLMIGFDLAAREGQELAQFVNCFMYSCRRRGVHLTYGYGGYNVRIIPPLTITREDIAFAVEVMEAAVEDAAQPSASVQKLGPVNRYTRRLLRKHAWRRLLHHCWRSSPEQIARKGNIFVRERLGTKRA